MKENLYEVLTQFNLVYKHKIDLYFQHLFYDTMRKEYKKEVLFLCYLKNKGAVCPLVEILKISNIL